MPLQETVAPMTVAQTHIQPVQQAQPQEAQVDVEIEEDDSLIIVQSPMVGVFLCFAKSRVRCFCSSWVTR